MHKAADVSRCEFYAVIPARFGSTRFPGKPLAMIAGKPMIQHVFERAAASGAREVWVATDDPRIESVCRGFTASVMMTRLDHRSGTDRVAEVAVARGWSAAAIVVNVQGDSPLVPARSIAQVAAVLDRNPAAAIATLSTPIREREDFENPNVVKVVTDRSGRALYFSRAAIPSVSRDAVMPQAFRHIGLYAYRVTALGRLTASGESCAIEEAEKLEQLRALWLGMEIRVDVAEEHHGPDVDVPSDIDAASAYLGKSGAAPSVSHGRSR
jgi:3-deoxy-manno-octulosonate cytidylyltransferase (CMP-KDO synthetase)